MRRPLHPVALALTVACLALVTGWATGPRTSVWTAVGAGYAACLAVVFTLAWARGSHSWMRAALLAAVGLWAWQAALGAWVIRSPTSAMLACAWLVLAGGSYWREVRDDGVSRRRE